MKKKLLQYGICGAIGAVIAVFMMAFNGLFQVSEASAKDVMAIVSDALFLPGALLASIGVLLWVAKEGLFDMISYGVRWAAHSLVPVIKLESRTFYEYKVEKDKKRRPVPYFVIIVGLVYIALAIVAIIISANL
ncbi:MAG: DUF3899 domain-containing protein [Ruminococcaceae bacterium]|nr:DUF3899 domain-containing protein [Oscillospiraceae bacterium]